MRVQGELLQRNLKRGGSAVIEPPPLPHPLPLSTSRSGRCCGMGAMVKRYYCSPVSGCGRAGVVGRPAHLPFRAHNPRRSGPFDAQGAHYTVIRGDKGHLFGG